LRGRHEGTVPSRTTAQSTTEFRVRCGRFIAFVDRSRLQCHGHFWHLDTILGALGEAADTCAYNAVRALGAQQVNILGSVTAVVSENRRHPYANSCYRPQS
jgi:hypothetical protein